MLLVKRGSFLLFFSLACAVGLSAADKPLSNPAKKEEAPKPAPASVPREVLLASVKPGKQWLIVRMLPEGTCKQFLSQRQGFSTALPTENKGDDFAPAASADGKHLAFYSNREGAVNLWLADSEGRGQRAVSVDDTSIDELESEQDQPIKFSPDSQKLVFLNHGNLWIYDLKSEELSSLSNDGGIQAFDFSSDRKWVAYYHKGSLRRVAMSGQPDELLAANAASQPSLAYGAKNELFYFYKGVWSIDTFTKEKRFVVGSTKSPNQLRINPKTSDSLAYVAISPDLRAEAYIVSPNKKSSGNGHADSGLITQGGAANPFFSADGKTLYFQREGGLWAIGTGGDKVRQLEALPCLMPVSAFLDYPSPPECAKP